jgi:[protein-PII] uridylyltransferase
MPLAEAEIRPRKPLFHLTTAEQILADLKSAIGDLSPRSSQARALALAEFKKALANARKTGEAELLDTGRGMRCAQNLSHAQDEIIRAIHSFAIREVYPVDNPSGAEQISIAAVGGYGRGTLAPGSDIDLLFILPYK